MRQVMTADVVRSKIRGLNESVDIWLEDRVLPYFILNGEGFTKKIESWESPFPLCHLYEQLVMRGFRVLAELSSHPFERYSKLTISLPKAVEND